jgi:hypothetical protein
LAVLIRDVTLGKPRVGGSDNMRQFCQIFRFRQPSRAVRHASVGLLILAMTAITLSGSAPQVTSMSPMAVLAANRRPEVRLRRLHLVRPDLIPYPIIYEVFC